jgi:hypothetical protein
MGPDEAPEARTTVLARPTAIYFYASMLRFQELGEDTQKHRQEGDLISLNLFSFSK